MVIFDIMVSHYNMTRWHEAGLTQHKGDLAAIQTAKQACKQQLLLSRPQQLTPVNQAHPSDQTAASLHHSALNLASSTKPASAAHHNQMPQAPYPTLPPNPEASSRQSEGQMGVTSAAASQLASPSLPLPAPQVAGSLEQQQQPVPLLHEALSGVACSPGQQQQPVTPLQPAVSGSADNQGQQQQQQPAAVQAKLTVRFDSQVPAAPQQAAAAASQQYHHGRHPARHSVHAAGEKVHAGLQPEKGDEREQWRAELEVRCTSLNVSCVGLVIEWL